MLLRLADAPPDDPLWDKLLRRTRVLLRKTLPWQFRGKVRQGRVVVDDVTQEVMTKLLAHNRQGLVRFSGDHEGAFDAYLAKIAENVVLDQWRHDALSVPAEVKELWQLEAALERQRKGGGGKGDPDAELRRRELWDAIERTLRSISRDRRDLVLNRRLFRLYYWEGFSIVQLARRRSVPLSTSSIARRLRTMRAALRATLMDHRPSGRGKRVPPSPSPFRKPPRRRRRKRRRPPSRRR